MDDQQWDQIEHQAQDDEMQREHRSEMNEWAAEEDYQAFLNDEWRFGPQD